MKQESKNLLGVVGAISALLAIVGIAQGNGGGGLLIGAGVFIVCTVYFIPALNAWERGHANSMGIFVLNFLLGWLLIPWVVALVWSFSRDRAAELLEQQRATAPADPPKPTASVSDELGKLAALHDRGLLTLEEFNVQKSSILNRQGAR